MQWKALALALLVAAAGCDRQGGGAPMDRMETEESVAVYDAPAPAPITVTASRAADMDDGAMGGEAAQNQASGPAAAPGAETPAPAAYLAYSYQVGLRAPASRVAGLMDAHVQACQQAGPAKCQLIGASRSGDPESYLSGYVSLRGEPAWLAAFMAGLDQQADDAGGRVTSRATNTEDLTRFIVDTEAELRAKRTLRDRLQQILETRPGRLADLLEAERALAQVQGEIDATQSRLAVARARVSMSELTLSYESQPAPVHADMFKPLTDAFANFLGLVIASFAGILTLIAVLAPWALVVALIWWATRKWRRGRRGLFWRHPTETEAPPTQG